MGFSLSCPVLSSSLALQSFRSSSTDRNRNSPTCWGCNEGFGACKEPAHSGCVQHWASADWSSADGSFSFSLKTAGKLRVQCPVPFPHPQCSFAKRGSPRASWVNMEDAG